jgi:target of EGR1 protein 1
MFIYHSLYASLPTELDVFVADLAEMFDGDQEALRSGLFDTKYVAEYVTREKASFLAYLFRKW